MLPIFGVLPTLVGPVVIMATVFPILFGRSADAFKRWTAAIVVSVICSVMYSIHWFFFYHPSGKWYQSSVFIWMAMSFVALVGCIWAWQRFEADDSEHADEGRFVGELAVLGGMCLAMVGYAFFLAVSPF
ncbi:MAG: hypothetical protein KatS3mg105_2117 [Gemmatales bacterium]|nr:MAG: hypothetical protein KatS3mg105_2117 [Gemmatales bacterium]